VTGTLNLLQAAVAAGHDRFVYTSTTSLMISQDISRETLFPVVILLDLLQLGVSRSRKAH
jgi:UDP-glucose 4-epimerase